MSVFKKQNDSIPQDQKMSFYDQIDSVMRGHNKPIGRASLCALIVGGPGAGKSGTVTDIVTFLKDDEVVVIADLDSGNEENLSEYYEDVYDHDQIKRFIPMQWGTSEIKGREMPLDYDGTMDFIRTIGKWVMDNKDGFKDGDGNVKKVRALVLDGLSKLKFWAEAQMRLDKGLGLGDNPEFKFWRERKKDVMEVLELYKSISGVDVFFIGDNDCAKPEKDKKALDMAIDNLMSQIVYFEVIDTPGKKQFFAEVRKSRQNFRSVGKRIKFAELDMNNPEKDYDWNTGKIIKYLQSEKNPILAKGDEKAEKKTK